MDLEVIFSKRAKSFCRPLVLSLAFAVSVAHAESANGSSPTRRNEAGYIGFGTSVDMAFLGYDDIGVERNARVSYHVEVGNGYFAIPISFSDGQNIQIYGIKPRVQYLIPIDDLFMAGPGVGILYNFLHSDVETLQGKVATNVNELGMQVSLQAMIRASRFIHILVTPASYDFNVWRFARGAKKMSSENNGNFSTVNNGLGIVYSAGIGIALSF
jgi:hypothetical protein